MPTKLPMKKGMGSSDLMLVGSEILGEEAIQDVRAANGQLSRRSPFSVLKTVTIATNVFL